MFAFKSFFKLTLLLQILQNNYLMLISAKYCYSTDDTRPQIRHFASKTMYPINYNVKLNYDIPGIIKHIIIHIQI